LRDPAQVAGDEASDRGNLLGFDFHIENGFNLVERSEAGYDHLLGLIIGFDQHLLLGVKLVADLADQLLEHPFQGEHPLGAVELVDHQGHVHAVGQQLGERGLEGLLAVDADHAALDAAQVELGEVAGVAEEILDVDQAEAVVQIPVAQGKAGMAAFLGHFQVLLEGQVQIKILHPVARQQDVGHHQFAHQQGVLEDQLGHEGHLRGFLAQQLNLGLQLERIEVGHGLVAPQAPDETHHPEGQAPDRPGEPAGQGDERLPQPQAAERVGKAERAREQLADQLVQRERNDKGQQRRQRAAEAREFPARQRQQRVQQRETEQRVEHQAGGEREPDDADRPVSGFEQRGQPPVRLDAVAQFRVEVAEADLDQAEFAGHQDRVQQQGQRDASQRDGMRGQDFFHLGRVARVLPRSGEDPRHCFEEALILGFRAD